MSEADWEKAAPTVKHLLLHDAEVMRRFGLGRFAAAYDAENRRKDAEAAAERERQFARIERESRDLEAARTSRAEQASSSSRPGSSRKTTKRVWPPKPERDQHEDEWFDDIPENRAKQVVSNLLEDDEVIAVDLDGTLAKDTGWKGISHIGDPVPKMFKRVQKWVDQGKKVVIFTARAHDPKAIPHVEKWLKKHGLPKLEVTNEKRPSMAVFYDDKARAIKRNKGVTEASDPKEWAMQQDPVDSWIQGALEGTSFGIEDIDGVEVYPFTEDGRFDLADASLFTDDPSTIQYGVSLHISRDFGDGGLYEVGEWKSPETALDIARQIHRRVPDAAFIDEITPIEEMED